MAWVKRLYAIFPGFGNPFVNDAVFQSVGNALTTSNTTSLTGLAPTLSAGRIRVKVYGGLTSPTLTAVSIVLSDGTDFVSVFSWAGTVTLSATPAGTQLATDGVMTSASAVLTSATASFNPGMVGKTIAVSKAGNTGGTLPLYTTVLSYQSATQVTLATAGLQTGGSTGATITLTESYLNGGSASTPAGIDWVLDFIVDINVSRIDVVTTGTGTSYMDLEISGTT